MASRALDADDDEVDVVALGRVLRDDGVAAVEEAVEDALLEERVEGLDPHVLGDGAWRGLGRPRLWLRFDDAVAVVEQLRSACLRGCRGRRVLTEWKSHSWSLAREAATLYRWTYMSCGQRAEPAARVRVRRPWTGT